jgi:hypothetical protein
VSDFDRFNEPLVGVTMLMADAAQVADGRLFILGGGLSEIGPNPQPLAIALLIAVPWDRANISHEWKIELVDEDGSAVLWDDRPVLVGGNFEAGRPAGAQPGTELKVPMAINFAALPIETGKRYEWRLSVNNTRGPSWVLRFSVRAAPPG